MEQIVAQVKLNLARDADHDPAGQKLEDTLDGSNRQQHQGIGQQLLMIHPQAQIVDGAAQHQWEKYPDSVVKEDANQTNGKAVAVLLQIRKQGSQAFGQHVLLIDVILPVSASLYSGPASDLPHGVGHASIELVRVPRLHWWVQRSTKALLNSDICPRRHEANPKPKFSLLFCEKLK